MLPGLYDGRNKTFFMAAYEGLRSKRTTSPIASVPTERMRRGDFSEITTQLRHPVTKVPYPGNQIPQSDLSAQALRLLQYYPLPNLPGTANGTGNNYQAGALTENENDQLLFRVDQTISNASRVYVRYNWVDAFDGFGNVVPSTGLFQPRTNKNTLGSWQQTLSPTLLNDFRIGYHRLDIDSLNNLMIAGVPSAGSDIGIPGFDGDVRYDNPGIPTIGLTGFSGWATPAPTGTSSTRRSRCRTCCRGPRARTTSGPGSTCARWRPAAVPPTTRGACSASTAR